MGIDIHMYAEVQRSGVWRPVENLENVKHLPDDPNAQRREPSEVYKGRNYILFDILAGVRNASGRTLDNKRLDAIAPPRGLPEDLSPEIRDGFEDWQGAALRPSYLLLSEILDFDWHGKVMRFEAMVDTVRWTDTYAASVGEGVLELFEGLTQHGDPSRVRLVFWFDH